METNARPRVAVAVVNLNGASVLDRCLDALAHQTVKPARIIVVDNASTDGSADGLGARHPGVEVMQLDENVGFAAGNNLAVKHARDCDWIALLNPDAFPEPKWLERLLVAADEHPEFSFFGSRLLMADAPELLDGVGDAYHVSGLAWRKGHGDPAEGVGDERSEIFSPCAAAALYRRDAFLGVGGFDEEFFCYFEDTDLSFRLRLVGHRCLYVPDAVVHHVGSASAGADSDFTIYHSFRNQVWTFVKNTPGRYFWLYLPQLVLVQALLLAAFAVRGRPGIILSAQHDALRGLRHMLQKRGVIQWRRTVAPSEVRRVMERGLGGYVLTFFRGWERLFAPLVGRPGTE